MYNSSIVQRRLSNLAKGIRQQIDPKFDYRDYSFEEIDFYTERLATAFDPDASKVLRLLSEDESAYIRHEMVRCKGDFGYWAARYSYIKDKHMSLVRFNPTAVQRLFLQKIADAEKEAVDGNTGDGLLFACLKARQLGVSTLSEIIIAHRVFFYGNTTALIAADVDERTQNLYEMIVRILDNLPWWMVPRSVNPKLDYRVKNKLLQFHDQDSTVRIGSSANMQGGGSGEVKGSIGTGQTLPLVHLCVAPNTLIRIANGFLKPISEVIVGDTVTTHTGTISTVRNAWLSPRKNELTSEIWLWGAFAPLSTTRDHKVLTVDGWKAAKNIVSNVDWIIHPVRAIKSEVKEYFVHRPVVGGNPKLTAQSRKVITTVHPIVPELGYLMGMYLAEGSLTTGNENGPTGVVWSVDVDEAQDLAARVEAYFSKKPYVSPPPKNGSRTRTVTLHMSGVARWVLQEFGKTGTKRVPDWAWDAGEAFCLAIIEGYIEGDGHWVLASNEITAPSIRVQLPLQIRDLIASLGLGWSSIVYRPAGVYYNRNCQAQWTICISGPTGQNVRKALNKSYEVVTEAKHWKWHNGHIAVQVSEISDGFSSSFYDLEIESEDHSFATSCGVLHNSELALWENPYQINDALMPSIPMSPRTFAVFESTAKGRGNWWHETWKQSIRGLGRLKPVFIPWYTDPDTYKFPAPVDWIPSDRAEAHALSVRETSSKWMGYTVELTKDQLYWWERTRAEYADRKVINKFLAEYAADDVSAFQASTAGVFPAELIYDMQQRSMAQHPVIVEIKPKFRMALEDSDAAAR